MAATKSAPPGTIPDQLQPFNEEAEQAVLGALLIDRDTLPAIALFLKPEDFFIIRYGWVYQAILDLAGRDTPPDVLTVSDELARQGRLEEVGGPGFLTGLINLTPSSLHAEYYARIVERDATRRRVVDGAGQMARLAFESTGEAGELLAQAEKILFDIGRGRAAADQTCPVAEVVEAIHQDVDYLYAHQGQAVLGLPTGLAELDSLLGGLQRGDLIILGGRPAMGKSSLAVQFAVTAARRQHAQVLLFSLEMNRKQLARRMISAECGIPEDRLKSARIEPGEWQRYLAAATAIAELPLAINDNFDLTPVQLRAEALRRALRPGLDLIVVDYLQLMSGGAAGDWQSKHQEIGAISRACKLLAHELNIPVVVLSQLSRRCEGRDNKRPMLSDLRESGSIEADADVVLFIYRDVVYHATTAHPDVAEVIVAKHRGGPTGQVNLYFDAPRTRFASLKETRTPLNSAEFGRG